MIYRYLQAESTDWENVEVRIWFGKPLDIVEAVAAGAEQERDVPGQRI